MDFSDGPITFVIAEPDGRAGTMTISVEVAPFDVARGEIVDADPSSWAITAARREDGSYRAVIAAPMVAEAPERIHATIFGLSGVSLGVTSVNAESECGRGDDGEYAHLLTMTGIAADLDSLESIRVSRIGFMRGEEPGLIYEQEFERPVTYDSVGSKKLYGVAERHDGGGCETGIRPSVFLLLLLMGALARRLQKP
jgi:hypothetical protein